MKQKIAFTLALLACSTFASADWVGSVNYSRFSDDIVSQGVDLGAVGFTAGYRFDIAENIRLVPEVRAGFGFGGDTITTDFSNDIQADFEINSYVGVSLRGEYILTDDIYVYGVTSYQNVESKVDGVRAGGVDVFFDSQSSNDTELGLGAGVGWQINERNAVEASYENFDGTDVITVGYRVNF